MKKLILLILVCSLLLLTVTSCLQNNNGEETTPQNTTESTTPIETTTSDASNYNPPIFENEIDRSSNFITVLLSFLNLYSVDINPTDFSLADKIDMIKSGVQPLYVAINPNEYYFVCGYYRLADEHNESRYCCCNEYTWIKYQNEIEIHEYLNDMKCVVTFQINKALTVTDIFSNDSTIPNFEHFQIYKPTFQNGANVEAPIVFEESFIYLNKSEKDTLYHSTSLYDHTSNTISHILLDGQHYISTYLYTIDKQGNPNLKDGLSNDYFKYEFGEYYDAIVSVMDIDRYNVIGENDRTAIYGVILFGDFFYGVAN